MAVSTLSIDLVAKIAGFEEAMNKAGRSVDGLNSKVGKAQSTLGNFAKGFIGALSVGALTSFVKSGIDAADALAKMSIRAGVATKDLASLKLAAEQADTNIETLGKGLGRLSRSIGDAERGNKLIADSLRQLGISVKDPKEAFFQLADGMQKIQDPTRRASVLSQVLGKSYEDLLPLLSQGGDALRQAAAASESFANAMALLAPDAEKFNDELATMKNNVAGVSATLISDFMPAMKQTLGIAYGVAEGFKEVGQSIGAFFAAVANPRQAFTIFKELFKDLDKQQTAYVKRYREIIAPAIAGISKSFSGKTDFSKATGSSAKATDPLDSILKGTQTAKIAEYNKLLGLLNDRYDKGRISAVQYKEATENLFKGTFSEAIKKYNDQLAYNAETEKLVAEQLKATNDSIYEQQQAWVEAGRTLTDEMKTPLENANIEFARLQELLDRGVISWETYSRAIFKVSESLEDSTKKLEEMDTFAKTAAKNIQNSFADFLFNPFENGLKGMAQSFGQMIQKMIADAVAADLVRRLFGQNGNGGAAGGILEGFGKLLGFANGGVATPFGALPGYASGGVTSGPTSGYPVMMHGTEAILPLKRGRDGKLGVSSGGGGHTINVYVNGTNAPDVRRAAGQGAREALGMLNGARRYG